MQEAYIFDAIRTPRGKGKSSGRLYEVTPIDLVAALMKEMEQRHDLDTSQVDDVVLGCVTPIGDQGADIARTAALYADWHVDVPGVQLNRFCASGLEAVNLAAMKVRSGWEKLVVAGGVESMSRVPMGSDGGAWVMDPKVNNATHFVPQGISADLIASLEGFSREDVDRYALESQRRAAQARANGRFQRSLMPVRDMNGLTILDHDELIRPETTLEGLGKLSPAFQMMGEMGFDAVAMQQLPGSGADQPRAYGRELIGHCGWGGVGAGGQQEGGQGVGAETPRQNPRRGSGGHGADDHAGRSRARRRRRR
jgi:acetyl-CoA C-acetyltransferase